MAAATRALARGFVCVYNIKKVRNYIVFLSFGTDVAKGFGYIGCVYEVYEDRCAGSAFAEVASPELEFLPRQTETRCSLPICSRPGQDAIAIAFRMSISMAVLNLGMSEGEERGEQDASLIATGGNLTGRIGYATMRAAN